MNNFIARVCQDNVIYSSNFEILCVTNLILNFSEAMNIFAVFVCFRINPNVK